MRYLKTFENINKLESDIIDAISDISDFDGRDDEYFINCPFVNELLVLHEKEYMHDVYWNSNVEFNVTYKKFVETYIKMAEKAPKTIISILKDKPELYSTYGEYIENLEIEVPGWISDSNKFNL